MGESLADSGDKEGDLARLISLNKEHTGAEAAQRASALAAAANDKPASRGGALPGRKQAIHDMLTAELQQSHETENESKKMVEANSHPQKTFTFMSSQYK